MNNKINLRKMAMTAILTAVVIVFQLLGSFIKFGPFSVSLVLLPIVVGAAICGPKTSTWLGFVFGAVVLIMDAGAFLAITIPGTIITVLAKGMLCGFVSGIVFKAFEKKNKLLAVVLAAVVCPIVNTGVFLLGCLVFFLDAVREWGIAEGMMNVYEYMLVGFVGVNFILEFAVNVILSPVVVKILDISKLMSKHSLE